MEYTRWHNVNAGSPQSRSRDANAKMSTSKRQTSRYAVVNEIERSNSEYQDVRVYAMKSIRLMYVHRLPIDRSLYACASARCRAHKHLHAPQCAERSREASCSARCLSSHRTRTNSNISTSSVSTVHRQLQHISHATTGKQHHSSYTCLIARLTLALPLPPSRNLLPFSKTIALQFRSADRR